MAEVVIAILAFLAEILIYVVIGIISLLRYAFSPKYREKRNEKWEQNPGRKVSALFGTGIGVFIILFFIGFTMVGNRDDSSKNQEPTSFEVTEETNGEDKKFTITFGGDDSKTNKSKRISFTINLNKKKEK